jgi:hypothetical protein
MNAFLSITFIHNIALGLRIGYIKEIHKYIHFAKNSLTKNNFMDF